MTARLGQLLEFTGKKDQGQEPEFEPREPAPRRQSLGDFLRQTRERYRQDLETVSAELRIRLVYLRAIEDDRFDLLPGPTYASGFLRSYAEYLGLNSRDVVRRYREEMAQLAAREEPEEPEEVVERRFPRRTVAAAVVALVAVLLGWRYLGGEGGWVQTLNGLPGQFQALIGGSEPSPEADTVAAEGPSPVTTAAVPAPEPVAAASDIASREPPLAVPAETATGGEEFIEPSVSVIAANGLPVPPVKPGLPGAETGPAALPEGETMLAAGAHEPPAPPTEPPPTGQTAASAPAPALPQTQPAVTPPAAPTAPDAAAAVAAVPAPPAIPAPPPTPATTTGQTGSTNLNALAAIPSVPSDALNRTRSQTFGATNAGSRVLLYARLESWIQVTDADNVPLWTRVLRAGDSYLLPDQPGLTLATGNAGGLDIFVDGKKVPSLGPVGVERRGIALDPERLKAGGVAP